MGDADGADGLIVIGGGIAGLLQPRFVHGIFGALYNGLHAVDELLDGAVMGGLTRLPR